ncbi:MAG: hypothetical protein M1829_003878 [Trizodia sp. TS-e1964]|nr:MAG: hypothetical protein M1829_003878 [Trizodia sp. TS-e1964]
MLSSSFRPRIRPIPLCIAVLVLYFFRTWTSWLGSAYIIVRTPVIWKSTASQFTISEERDQFDVTFGSYSNNQSSSLPQHPDLVPPILHHINLGGRPARQEWLQARENCIQYHQGWDAHLWDDEKANKLVEESYPHLKQMWDNYKYPVQRVDALRYMVLYKYGGVILDMDLDCKRSLGPLRRFGFVAPAAHPIGFSIGLMMASKRHPFVGELVRNLPIFDRDWFRLPYPTVMFSTGCHYASAIHTMQQNRTDLRVLVGPDYDFEMHRLSGDVETPLFHHLGTSSWHSFDASIIVSIGHTENWMPSVHLHMVMCILAVSSFVAIFVGALSYLQRRRQLARMSEDPLHALESNKKRRGSAHRFE